VLSSAVVIPVHNRARLVLDALDSVGAQTHTPDQVIVVDDASTDDTAKAVAAWIERSPLPSRLITLDTRGGAGNARNVGLAACEAEAIGFLDSDDLWPPDFLERTTGALGDAVAVTTDIQVETAGTQARLRAMDGSMLEEIFHDAGIGSATLLSGAAVRAEIGYDVSLPTGQDAELFLRLWRDGGRRRGDWRHAPGAPTIKRQGHAATDADAQRRWAEIYEKFLRDDKTSRSACEQILTRRWFVAGRDLDQLGRTADARDCYRKALAWRPGWLRARTALVRTYLPF